MYALHTVNQNGDSFKFDYDPTTSYLDIIKPPTEEKNFKEIFPVSHTAPGTKTHAPNVLKIQMGLACNYSCSYCLQALEVVNETVSLLDDVNNFLEKLDEWLFDSPNRIELWGGEPFVYWAKIKKLIPELHKRFPSAEFVMITNGSLLDQEKIDFIKKYDISIGISHDGPGQLENRGPDPLKDPEKRKWIQKLFEERCQEGKVGFNAVLTKNNFDLEKIKEWFEAEFPDTPIQVGMEGVVITYDVPTLLGSGGFNPSQLKELSDAMFYHLIGKEPDDKIRGFFKALGDRMPLTSFNQKCGMDRPDMISVDLKGNVTTCQNTGAEGRHKIGQVDNFDDIQLDTATHFSHREECNHCPVVQLCKGSCMYLESDYFAQSCHNEYALNLAYLRAAIFHLTGTILTKIEGDIRRPENKVPGRGSFGE